jgi:hypothetical protein
MDEEHCAVATHKKKRTSLFRRLTYFVVMLATGGGAGIGGWAFKDHPRMQALLGIVLGKSGAASSEGVDLKSALATAVTTALERDDPHQTGVFKVKIAEIKLDPKLFPQGKTVDVQARVRKFDGAGQQTTVWESKSFGENLGVAGRDELTATWVNRPFEIEWSRGDQIVVEVWNRKSGLFEQKQLRMALPEPGVFPLASGIHALEISDRDRAARNSDLNHIIFQSERIRTSAREDTPQLAERPIVIK